MAGLTARKVRGANLASGVEAEVLLTEPDGNEHFVRCLCKLDGTTDIGDPTEGRSMQHLTSTYSEQTVFSADQQVMLGDF